MKANKIIAVAMAALAGVASVCADEVSSAGAGGGETIAVTAYDEETMLATLALSGIEGDMGVYALAAETDPGAVNTGWTEVYNLGRVSAGATSFSALLPENLDIDGLVVRFALIDEAASIDLSGDSLRTVELPLACLSNPLSSVLGQDTRTVTLKSFDPSTGTAEFGFSAGETAKRLYVAYDSTDRGDDLKNWKYSAWLADVPASATTLTCTVPAKLCGAESGVLRFFLLRWAGEGSAPRRRPVRFLLATGTQYINTGVKPVNTDLVEIRVRPLGPIKDQWIFSSRNVPATSRFALLLQADGRLRVDRMNGTSYSTAKLPADKDCALVADFGSRYVTLDGVKIVTTMPAGAEAEVDQDLFILAGQELNTGKPVVGSCNMRLYDFRLSDAKGVVKLDLSPCLDGDGRPCLYDAVSRRLLHNAGTGEFGAGGSVSDVPKTAQTSSESVEVGPSSLTKFQVSLSRATRRLSVELGPREEPGRLFLAYGKRDRGWNVSDWEHSLFLCPVPASDVDTILSFALPAEVEGDAGRCIRVFYQKADSNSRVGLESAATGKAWIDTGIVPTANMSIRIEFKLMTSGMAIFGLAEEFYFFQIGMTSYWAMLEGTGGSSGSLPKTWDGNVHTLKFGPEGGVFDGVDMGISVNVGKAEPKVSMSLFGRRTKDGSKIDKQGACVIYRAEIWDGDEKVRDLVPFGTGNQMYDLVTKSCIDKSGSDSLKVVDDSGADVLKEEDIALMSPCFKPGLIIFLK